MHSCPWRGIRSNLHSTGTIDIQRQGGEQDRCGCPAGCPNPDGKGFCRGFSSHVQRTLCAEHGWKNLDKSPCHLDSDTLPGIRIYPALPPVFECQWYRWNADCYVCPARGTSAFTKSLPR